MARFDDDITVIVITGHGEKFFSTGASISMLDSVFRVSNISSVYANETLSRWINT